MIADALGDLGEDVRLTKNEKILAFDGDVGSAVLGVEDLVAFSVDDGGAVLGADGRYSALPGAPTVALRLRLTPDP